MATVDQQLKVDFALVARERNWTEEDKKEIWEAAVENIGGRAAEHYADAASSIRASRQLAKDAAKRIKDNANERSGKRTGG